MSENRAAYRNIMKGTAVFGGVQVFTILINIFRGKLIAIFLGPVGMGITALLFSVVSTIQQFSSLGLNFSAVKDISQIREKEDIQQLASIVQITRRLVFLTAILGAVITVCFSPSLSSFAFGNKEYTLDFLLLGIMVFFTTLTLGETALLQGMRQLKKLAISTIVGALVGLVIGTPLYYIWGTKGIVPAMILLSVSTYIANRYFTSGFKLPKISIPRTETMERGKQMVSLGVFSMLSALLGSLTITLINAYIRRVSGSEADLGLIQAATSISNQYVGLVFTAMAVDYFPRLAAICDDRLKLREAVNQQIDIIMLIVTPLILAVLVSTPLIVRLLLSPAFMPTIPLLRWIGFGLFFKAVSFPLGYIAFAKGDKTTFLWFEGIYGNILLLIGNIVGYTVAGVVGVGISFVITYIIYLISVILLTRIKYQFHLSQSFVRSIFPLLVMNILVFGIMILGGDHWWTYVSSGVIFIFSVYYSCKELDRKIGLKELLKSRFKK